MAVSFERQPSSAHLVSNCRSRALQIRLMHMKYRMGSVVNIRTASGSLDQDTRRFPPAADFGHAQTSRVIGAGNLNNHFVSCKVVQRG